VPPATGMLPVCQNPVKSPSLGSWRRTGRDTSYSGHVSMSVRPPESLDRARAVCLSSVRFASHGDGGVVCTGVEAAHPAHA
jgi:hypothetical protein